MAYDLVNRRRSWMVEGKPRGRPAAGDGRIYFVDGGAIVALQTADGSSAWRVSYDEPLSPHLVWDNGWLIASTESGTLLSHRGRDGLLVWRRDLGSPLQAAPSLAADRVYVPLANGRIAALQVETGTPLWQRGLGGPAGELLALDDRIFAGSSDNYFYALEPREGGIAWRWRTGGDVLGPPIVDDKRVYFVSKDNVLYALDRKSGSQQWRRILPIRPTRGPMRLADMIVASGSVSTLHAFALKDGQPAGDINVGGAVIAGPHPVSANDAALPFLVVVTADLTGTALTAIGHQEKEAGTPDVAPPVSVMGSLAPTRSAWWR